MGIPTKKCQMSSEFYHMHMHGPSIGRCKALIGQCWDDVDADWLGHL